MAVVVVVILYFCLPIRHFFDQQSISPTICRYFHLNLFYRKGDTIVHHRLSTLELVQNFPESTAINLKHQTKLFLVFPNKNEQENPFNQSLEQFEDLSAIDRSICTMFLIKIIPYSIEFDYIDTTNCKQCAVHPLPSPI